MGDTPNDQRRNPMFEISPRSVTSLQPPRGARCRGAHHEDAGEIVVHDVCGQEVVRKNGTSILCTIFRVGPSDTRGYYCWQQHTCDPNWIELTAAVLGEQLAAGKIVKHAVVKVVKGRKVPIGTIGPVVWTGGDRFGDRVGIRAADGQTVFTAADNVELLADDPTNQAAIAHHQQHTARLNEWIAERDRLEAAYQAAFDVLDWAAMATALKQQQIHNATKPFGI